MTEHPYDPSWGYQPTGLYARPRPGLASRRGSRVSSTRRTRRTGGHHGLGARAFPDRRARVGEIRRTALYEHEDPRQGFHPDWNTAIYNFGRKEVSSYLTNNALYWLEKFHIDGLRVDAVASMLYLDYSRKPGEWVPNRLGGNHNLEAVAFLQRVNAEAYGHNPGIFTAAEESTSWSGVTAPTYANGLGFGFKWNMGFMNDTLLATARPGPSPLPP